ncbi:MAG: NAD-dependent protein deacylase [Clostridiales bacterium]|jgi:NAD-dependent deacetylase|nr:NAD-dependent protein deacylase [Clostridiales bacterium]
MYDESQNIVFFGGAGVSTESGVPDFRSKDGLYSQKYDYPPEYMLSKTCYVRHPVEFFKFYKDKMLLDGIEPNAAHLKLSEMEKASKLKAVITQNIDGLHQKAGSKVVYEVHGSVLRNYCEKCNAFYDEKYMKNALSVPICDKCGGRVKPDVVLYEEGLDNEIWQNSINAISRADMLIVAGTSLVVYPAANLVRYFNGKYLVIINLQPTNEDSRADLVIREKVGEVLRQIKV